MIASYLEYVDIGFIGVQENLCNNVLVLLIHLQYNVLLFNKFLLVFIIIKIPDFVEHVETARLYARLFYPI